MKNGGIGKEKRIKRIKGKKKENEGGKRKRKRQKRENRNCSYSLFRSHWRKKVTRILIKYSLVSTKVVSKILERLMWCQSSYGYLLRRLNQGSMYLVIKTIGLLILSGTLNSAKSVSISGIRTMMQNDIVKLKELLQNAQAEMDREE